jgi:hypothetical protein
MLLAALFRFAKSRLSLTPKNRFLRRLRRRDHAAFAVVKAGFRVVSLNSKACFTSVK